MMRHATAWTPSARQVTLGAARGRNIEAGVATIPSAAEIASGFVIRICN